MMTQENAEKMAMAKGTPSRVVARLKCGGYIPTVLTEVSCDEDGITFEATHENFGMLRKDGNSLRVSRQSDLFIVNPMDIAENYVPYHLF